MSGPRVLLYGRAGCHLCADARAVLDAACAPRGETYAELDVDDDPDLRRRYGDAVPVATVDGAVVGFWRLDPARLAAALDAPPAAGDIPI